MQNFIDQHPALFIAGFLLYFVPLWCLVGWIISFLGGWRALSTRFRANTEFTGHIRSFCSGAMRFNVHYGNILRIGTDQNGLYLAVLFLFRIGHPPIYIPWNEITALAPTRILIFKYTTLKLGNEQQIPLRLSTALTNQLLESRSAGASLRMPIAEHKDAGD